MKKEVTWTAEEWKDWKWHQKHRIRNMEQLEEWIDVTPDEREAFRLTDPIFHMGITPYYAALMDPTNPDCPIRLQAVPKMEETHISPISRPRAFLHESQLRDVLQVLYSKTQGSRSHFNDKQTCLSRCLRVPFRTHRGQRRRD